MKVVSKPSNKQCRFSASRVLLRLHHPHCILSGVPFCGDGDQTLRFAPSTQLRSTRHTACTCLRHNDTHNSVRCGGPLYACPRALANAPVSGLNGGIRLFGCLHLKTNLLCSTRLTLVHVSGQSTTTLAPRERLLCSKGLPLISRVFVLLYLSLLCCTLRYAVGSRRRTLSYASLPRGAARSSRRDAKRRTRAAACRALETKNTERKPLMSAAPSTGWIRAGSS